LELYHLPRELYTHRYEYEMSTILHEVALQQELELELLLGALPPSCSNCRAKSRGAISYSFYLSDGMSDLVDRFLAALGEADEVSHQIKAKGFVGSADTIVLSGCGMTERGLRVLSSKQSVNRHFSELATLTRCTDDENNDVEKLILDQNNFAGERPVAISLLTFLEAMNRLTVLSLNDTHLRDEIG